MTSKKELLKKREKIKSKKPAFVRRDAHKRNKLDGKWRKPKGHHNKMRLKRRGYGRVVKTGWGSPKEVKGLHPSGLKPVRVHNPQQVEEVDSKEEGIIIASNVGDRKRVNIIEKAQDENVEILNLDGDEYLKQVEQEMKERKQKKKEKEEKEEQEEKEKESESQEDEKEEKMSQEERKKQEKKEQEEVITKSK